MTLLSICIPTRNRQEYAISAIREMLNSKREDFEIVLADNSDDSAPLTQFVANSADSRVKYLAPEENVLSKRSNWNRMIPETSGEWVSIIDDDDYLDPELCEVIRVAKTVAPKVDALTWERLYFIWPDARSGKETTSMPTGNHLIGIKKEDMMRKFFFWEGASDRPKCPFGVYHGALKRSLLEEIRETFKGQYFVHPIVDYDNIARTLMVAKQLVFFERPMSVFSTCKQSNTMAMHNEKAQRIATDTFLKQMDYPVEAKNFPFPIKLGLTAQIGQVIESFKQEQGIEITAWEENFIKACARDCESHSDHDIFKDRVNGYRNSIVEWQGEKALKNFKPVYKFREDLPNFIGFRKNELKFNMSIGDASSTAEYYKILDAIMFPVSLLAERAK